MSATFGNYDVLAASLVASPDERVAIYLTEATNELDLSRSVQPEVDAASHALERAQTTLQSLEEKRTALGLSNTFLEDQLESFDALGERIDRHFETELESAKSAFRSIQEAKQASGELSVAREKEKGPLLKLADGRDSAPFSEDLDWESLQAVPSLERSENLPPLYEERAGLIDEYESIRQSLEGGVDTHGLRDNASKLRDKSAKLTTQRNQFVDGLQTTMGYAAGQEYSAIFPYVPFPESEFEQARQVDVGAIGAFDRLKALGVEADKAIEMNGRLVIVEAYLRMKVYREYCDYIAVRCDASDAEQNQMKIQIANALKLGDYFWGFGNGIDELIQLELDYLNALDEHVDRAYEILPEDLRDTLDEMHIRELVIRLHQENLITETVLKTGKRSKSFKGDLSLFLDPLKIKGEDQRCSFSVSTKAGICGSIDALITNFVRNNQVNFDLKDVKGVFENPFFPQTGRMPLFIRKESFKLFGTLDKTKGTRSVKEKVASVLNVQLAVLQPEAQVDLYLAGFAINLKLFYEELLLRFKRSVSAIEKRVDRLLEKLPIGIQIGETIVQKLHRIAEFLLAQATDIEREYLDKAHAFESVAQAAEERPLDSMDRIRDFFKIHIRNQLADRYAFHQAKINELVKEQIEKKDSTEDVVRITKAILAQEESLRNLDAQTATLAVQIYNLYRCIYDPKDKSSLISAYLKLIHADLKHADFELLRPLLVQLNKIAPSLKRDINQILLTFKTELAVRAQLAHLHAQIVLEEEKFDQAITLNRLQYGLLQDAHSTDREAASKDDFYIKEAQRILDRGASFLAQKTLVERKIVNLSERIAAFEALDPRGLPAEHQAALYSQTNSINPHIQMWLDLKKEEGEIVALASRDLEVDSPHSSHEGQELLYQAVDTAIAGLDTEVNFFDIKSAAKLVPHKVLVPVLFGVSGHPNLFRAFSTESIAKALVYTYKKTKEMMLEANQGLINQFSFADYNKCKADLEAEIGKLEGDLAPARARLDALRVSLQDVEAWPQRKAALEALLLDLQALKEARKIVKDLEARHQNVSRAFENTEIKKSEGAQRLLDKRKRRLESKLEDARTTLLGLEERVGAQKEALEIKAMGSGVKKVIKEIEVELTAHTASSAEPFLAQTQTGRAEFADLNEKVMDLEERQAHAADELKARVEHYENEERQREYSQALKDLEGVIKERALEAAFRVFGFKFEGRSN